MREATAPHARPARPARRASRSRRSRSALAAADEVPEGVVALRATYPMSRYFAAFDGAVAAAGYNAYHELIALGVPSLFVPMPRDTDDQPARARYARARRDRARRRRARPTRSLEDAARAPARPGASGARSAAASAPCRPADRRGPGRGVAAGAAASPPTGG